MCVVFVDRNERWRANPKSQRKLLIWIPWIVWDRDKENERTNERTEKNREHTLSVSVPRNKRLSEIIVACNFELLCLCYGLLVKQSSMSCIFRLFVVFRRVFFSLGVYFFSLYFGRAFFLTFVHAIGYALMVFHFGWIIFFVISFLLLFMLFHLSPYFWPFQYI